MQFGYFCTPFFSADPPASETANRLVENARTAREAGFDYVELGDHHVTPEGRFLQNVPTAGRLAAEFDHVGVTFLLPLYHPLYVAEYLGTLGAFVERIDAWPVVGGDAEDAAKSFGALRELGADEVVFGVASEDQQHVRETLRNVSAAREWL